MEKMNAFLSDISYIKINLNLLMVKSGWTSLMMDGSERQVFQEQILYSPIFYTTLKLS